MEERLQLAVFIDFDNIEIGVKTTLNTELDLSLVLEALKERGEVVSKSAYGDWARAGMHSRTLTEHAVHMVQRNVTPRGDKNGADINLVVDALEMAFTRPHITGFCIVGGDSDFIALVEKLKQFGKRVLVVGGRSFTSGVLQRNCHEFISYENLLSASRGGRSQSQSRGAVSGRLPMAQGLEKVQRAIKILADRGVEPQLGPLKSTLLQLDSTFSERDYGASSFREFIQRLDDQGHLHLRRIDQGYLVEMNGERPREASAGRGGRGPAAKAAAASAAAAASGAPAGVKSLAEPGLDEGEREEAAVAAAADGAEATVPAEAGPAAQRSQEGAIELLRAVVDKVSESRAGKPMYVRHLAQGLRAADPTFDEQAYGFRTLTELVHLGQREGILRMQRDRQGAWRISSAAPLPAASAPMAGDNGDGASLAAPEPDSETAAGEEFAIAEAADAPVEQVAEAAAESEPAGADGAAEAGAAGTDDATPAGGRDPNASGRRGTSRRRKTAAAGSSARAPRAAAAKGTKTSTRTPRARARKKTTAET